MFDFGISVKVGREDYGKVGNKTFPSLFSLSTLALRALFFLKPSYASKIEIDSHTFICLEKVCICSPTSHHIYKSRNLFMCWIMVALMRCSAGLNQQNAMYITQKKTLSMVTMPLCWCCFFRTWEQNVKTRELKLSRRRLREWRLNKIYFVVFFSKRLRIARCIYRIHLYEVSKTLHFK